MSPNTWPFLRLHYLRLRTLRAYRFGGDWRQLPVRDNGEPLALVPKEMSYPYYAVEMRLTTDHNVWLREGVLERVLHARCQLQKLGLDLLVYDGWRSIELQEALFWYYLRQFTVRQFDLTDYFAAATTSAAIKKLFDELSPDRRTVLREANRRYVSWPSKDPDRPSPHATGGAVDVWIREHDGGHANLGVPFDWMEDDAGAFYHLKRRRRRFPGNDRLVCRRRGQLLLAMADAGFSVYPAEFWHFNAGNQMDSLVTGQIARYSYIEP